MHCLTTLIETHQHTATRHARRVARVFLRQYGDAHLPDIEQEGLLGLWQAIETYDTTKSQLTTWIQHCVDYRVMEYMQETRRQIAPACASLDAHCHTHGDLEAALPALEQQLLQYDLSDAFRRLTWLQRQIIEKRYSDGGCSRRTCAEYFGTSTETIKQQEAHALTRLRYYLRYHREPSTRKDQ